MKTTWKMAGLAAIGALALSTVPAGAQEATQEVHVYGGQLFGDKLTDTAISGSRPELDDDITYGVRYGYNFSKDWGLEISAGNTSSAATGLPGRDIDLDLTTVELSNRFEVRTLSGRRRGIRLGESRYSDRRHRERPGCFDR